MNEVAFVDTSVIVFLLLEAKPEDKLYNLLKEYRYLVSSNLMEAELYSVAKRERIDLQFPRKIIRTVTVLHPTKSLTDECERVVNVGYLRGADLYHVAVALACYSSIVSQVDFITLDLSQRAIAKALGFTIPELE